MLVLRDKKTHRPLALAFSKEGLQFTTDSFGKYIFFKKARPVIKNSKMVFEGDLTMNPNVYIEIYAKRSHNNRALDSIEHAFAYKARQYGGVPAAQDRRSNKGISGSRRRERTFRNS